ncbi:transposase domain protein [Brucella pseudogrignonensis]|jgi:hypothetical protein|uniref:Transposase domain protein n=1 Tax=Brucella pseudogrignonensis TaxID=419475 RepID=A0A256GMX1_9HYPH|nr:transposase domain protein [Brucella pseudogrignonensis]
MSSFADFVFPLKANSKVTYALSHRATASEISSSAFPIASKALDESQPSTTGTHKTASPRSSS